MEDCEDLEDLEESDLKDVKCFVKVCVPEDQAGNYTTCDGAIGGDAKV